MARIIRDSVLSEDYKLTPYADYTTFTMTQDIIFDGVDVTLYAIPPTLASQCSGSGSGGGRFCTYTGKAELSHYCSDDGCYPPDGNACGEFCEPESES